MPLPSMRAVLSSLPHVDVYEYDGAGHGFATEFGERRLDASAKLAEQRIAVFFAANLT